MNWLLVISNVLIGTILFSWVGWPIILTLAGRIHGRSKTTHATPQLPRLSVVFAAHNEASVIEQKLRNTLSLDYPNELLEVIVVSDGSTDATAEILRRFDDTRVKKLIAPVQTGKSASLNRAIPVATGDLILFTDANSMLDASAARILASHFADPKVGCVSGELRYVTDGNLESTGGSLYWKYDIAIKRGESALGRLIGAVGPIFVMRRSLWRELRPIEVPDLALGLAVLEAGMRAHYDSRAFCTEHVAESTAHERKRYRRIVSRSIPTALASLGRLLRGGLVVSAIGLLAHKISRYFTAPLLLVAFASALFSPPNAVTSAFVLATLTIAIAAALGTPILPTSRLRVFRLFWFFACVQISAGHGVIDWVLGKNAPTWAVPTRTLAGGSALSTERAITRSPE